MADALTNTGNGLELRGEANWAVVRGVQKLIVGGRDLLESIRERFVLPSVLGEARLGQVVIKVEVVDEVFDEWEAPK